MYLSELEFADPELALSTRSGALAALVLEFARDREALAALAELVKQYPSMPVSLAPSLFERECLRYFGE